MHLWGNLPDGQLVAVLEWLYERRRARREAAAAERQEQSTAKRPNGQVVSMASFKSTAEPPARS